MLSAVVWVQCHIRCVGPRCVRSDYNASRFFLASDLFDESGWHFTLQMQLHTVRAGPFWQLYRSVQAIPDLCRGYHKGYHCFINAAIFRDVSLFEGSIQILDKRTNLTVSIHRQICIISEMEISPYLVKFIASHRPTCNALQLNLPSRTDAMTGDKSIYT